jgi:hypothetical protein
MYWQKPRSTGDLPPATRAHTMTAVHDCILVFGGGNGMSDSFVIFVIPSFRSQLITTVMYNIRIRILRFTTLTLILAAVMC